MPRSKNSPSEGGWVDEKPPRAMTWAGAFPYLILGIIFDAVRLLFEMFWFFGPALIGLYCVTKVGGVAVVGKLLAAGCVAGATTLGVAGVVGIEAFGVVMAMAVGLLGWMTIGTLLLIRNSRIFKENALLFIVSLAISEVPIVGSVPALTLTLVKMFSNQIKLERAARKAWEAAYAAKQVQRRQQQAAELMQIQQTQAAANDKRYTQEMDEAA